MNTFQDFRRQIPLTDYLVSLGYEFQKGEGLKYPVFYNKNTDDKIFIVNKDNPSQMGYQNQRNPADKGTLIDFVISRTDDGLIFRTDSNVFKHVNNVLSNFLGLSVEERARYKPSPVIKGAKQPKAKGDFKKIIAKLENRAFLFFRELTDVEIKHSVFKNRIFNPNQQIEDSGYKTNILFPLYDRKDEIVGISVRNKEFKALFEGSDKEIGFWRSNVPAEVQTMVVTESAIDCLSFAALYKNPAQTMYASGEGNFSEEQISGILDLRDEKNIQNFFLGFDNDKAGAKYELRFMLTEMKRKGIEWEYSKSNASTLSFNLYIKDGNNIIQSINKYNENIDMYQTKDVETSYRIEKNKIEGGVKITCQVNSHYALSSLANMLNRSFDLNIKQTRPILNDWNEDLKCYKEIRKEGNYISYKEMKPLLREKLEAINIMTSKQKNKIKI
ncbi:MAG: toprim domain-containing protein [Bacteroidales bacterium]